MRYCWFKTRAKLVKAPSPKGAIGRLTESGFQPIEVAFISARKKKPLIKKCEMSGQIWRVFGYPWGSPGGVILGVQIVILLRKIRICR